MNSSKIFNFPICSSPIAIRKISGPALQLTWLWEGFGPNWSHLQDKKKKIYWKKSITIYFVLNLKDISFERFNLAKFYTSFMIFLLFLLGEILISVSVNQHNVLRFSPTQIVIYKVMLSSLMLSHWNWHQWY